MKLLPGFCAAAVLVAELLQIPALSQQSHDKSRPIFFKAETLPAHLQNDVSAAKNVPEAMLGGVAVFDYNNDGRPDIFVTNGANISTLRKDDPKYRNHLFRNDGGGKFTDVTESAGLAGLRIRHGRSRGRLRQ